MATLGDVFLQKPTEDKNNFLLLRLFAASLVVYGHAFALAAKCDGCHDIVSSWFHYLNAGALGLHIFFVVSGFLVTASFDKRYDLVAFTRARLLRLIPGLFVSLIVVAFVMGPLVSTVPVREYFSSWEPYRFILVNGSLYGYYPSLPGVFLDNHFPGAPSGTLWTLSIEARMYLFVALIGVLGLIRYRSAATVGILAFVAVAIFVPGYMPIFGVSNDGFRLGAFFAAGALLYVNRQHAPFDGRILPVLLVVAALSLGLPAFEIVAGAIIAYGALWLAYGPKVRVPGWVHDYSYGIYLYGFPIEQLINHLAPHWGPYRMMLIALPLSWLTGAASWFLVEKRCLSVKSKIVTRAPTEEQNVVKA